MNEKIKKIIAVSLVLFITSAMVVPVHADTKDLVQPFSSPYLSNYSGSVYAAGNGVVQVWYDVTGTRTLQDIGSLSILLYESMDNTDFYWVETFRHINNPIMLGHNTGFYSSHVSYNGVVGRYYKAYIGIYGGDGTNGTNRYFWTSSVRAT